MTLLGQLRITRRIIGVALLALLLGQWAALAHSVQHAREPTGPAVPAYVATDDSDVWGHQVGTSACHLMGHLLTGQAPGVANVAVPCSPLAAVPAMAPTAPPYQGAASRAYEARGPPTA